MTLMEFMATWKMPPFVWSIVLGMVLFLLAKATFR